MPKAKENAKEQSQEQQARNAKVSQKSKPIQKNKKKDDEHDAYSQGSASATSPTKVASKNVIKPIVPKKAITSYMCFINARREEFRGSNPTLSICEVVSALAKVWNSLSDDQKKQYEKIAEVDQKRFQKETAELNKKGYFINKDGENSKQLFEAKERAKTAVKPKKPLSAYMYFMGENFKKMKAENPDLKVTEGAKLTGQAWAKMEGPARKKYDNLHDQDQKRFDKQQEEVDEKGFFTLEDGTKSCDAIQKKFKYPKGTKMPEKAVQAYGIYCRDNIEKIMQKQSLNKEEAQSVCSQVWEKLSEKQKLKYENMHLEDVKRYEKQVVSVQQKGFYLKDDGTKSQN